MKIFIVIVNFEQAALIQKHKSKYTLISFEFLRRNNFLWTNDILLDSGAFSFLKKGKADNVVEYAQEYANFINKNSIKKYFELDLYDIIGVEKTEHIRDMLEQKTGIKSIPVFHRSLGKDYYLKLITEYSRVALGGFAIKQWRKNEYNIIPWFLEEAKKINCKIHGLGFSGTSELKKYKFDSVDSSTWETYRFGGVQYFDNVSKTIKRKSIGRLRYDKRLEITEQNMKAWIMFQNYAERNL